MFCTLFPRIIVLICLMELIIYSCTFHDVVDCGQSYNQIAHVRRPSHPVKLTPNAMSVTLLANDMGDKETISGAVHRYPTIFLEAEENPGNPQLGNCRIEIVCLII